MPNATYRNYKYCYGGNVGNKQLYRRLNGDLNTFAVNSTLIMQYVLLVHCLCRTIIVY